MNVNNKVYQSLIEDEEWAKYLKEEYRQVQYKPSREEVERFLRWRWKQEQSR